MNAAVFGLGYVGSVSAACLAADGHNVVGVDVSQAKVDSITLGRSPIVEPGLDDLLAADVRAGRLRATTSAADAVASSDVSLICVGTPGRKNGSLDLTYVRRVCEQIGQALRDTTRYHVVVVRSTVLPGTTTGVVIPALEAASGKVYGQGFGVATNPEFLREGSALKDFREPPLTIVGHNHAADASGTLALYAGITAPVITTSIPVAEMVKYTSNAWHALKVSFANEIGNVCKGLGIDSHEVMDVFCQDQSLNLSARYLKPGFAFGGSCLPKDVRALQFRAREIDVELPVIQAILPSNRLQIQQAFEQVMETGRQCIGLLGFSFKPGTDDLRESPLVVLAEALLGKGKTLRIYDRHVSLARLVGANKQYIDQQIPHLSSLLCQTIDEVIADVDVVIIGNQSPEFTDPLYRCRPDQIIVDLARLPVQKSRLAAAYHGISW
jgi:GDP-mannose 6-dehydrogenase